MPKRSRSGLVSMPARVVAPASVKGGRSSLVERLAALPRSLDEDFELPARLFLPDVLGQRGWAQRPLELLILRRRGLGRDQAVGFDCHWVDVVLRRAARVARSPRSSAKIAL